MGKKLARLLSLGTVAASIKLMVKSKVLKKEVAINTSSQTAQQTIRLTLTKQLNQATKLFLALATY